MIASTAMVNYKVKSMLRHLFIVSIRFYQYIISPALGKHCRFEPSCSHYSFDAITTFGTTIGLRLTVKRLLRCHPWHPGGYDPIPQKNR